MLKIILIFFITAVYKCLQANRKRHKAHFFQIKRPFTEREREREISSAYHSTTYFNIVCIGAQQNVIENSGVSAIFIKENVNIDFFRERALFLLAKSVPLCFRGMFLSLFLST